MRNVIVIQKDDVTIHFRNSDFIMNDNKIIIRQYDSETNEINNTKEFNKSDVKTVDYED